MQKFTYLIVRVDLADVEQHERIRRITRSEPMKIGYLYTCLGSEFPGTYRVLALV